MYLIQQITVDARQKQTLILPDGSQLKIQMTFRPMQLGWFFDELTHEDFTITGIRICITPNLLYQFKNKIPFGIACFSNDKREPTLQEDFSSGNANLYVLTAEEVQNYLEYLSGQIRP